MKMIDVSTLTAVMTAMAFRSKKLWRPTRISSPESSGAHTDDSLSQSFTRVLAPCRKTETLAGSPISATPPAMATASRRFVVTST